jgi:hypothetical protein
MGLVRRLLFATILVLVVAASVEAASWLLLLRVAPQGAGRLLAAAALESGEGARGVRVAPRGADASDVIHPYLGYATQPEPGARTGALTLEELGFLLGGGPLVTERDPAKAVVAVFGGSLAAMFVEARGPQAAARAVPELAGREVVVLNTAQGGYKQPQPLLALTYLLSLGAKIDVAILIDGFNDVALAPVENVPNGVFPFYPRSWAQRVASLNANPKLRALVGEIAFLQRLRAEVARGLSASPLAASRTVLLCWTIFQRWLDQRIDARRLELTTQRSGDALDYSATGPRWSGDDAALAADLVAMWKASSLQMHRLAEANGIRFLHFLQPNQYVPDAKPMSEAERAVAVHASQPYAKSIPLAWPLLRAAGRELAAEGVRFHDLTLVFAGVPEPLYVDDCCHVGPRGNEILAQEVGRALAAALGQP